MIVFIICRFLHNISISCRLFPGLEKRECVDQNVVVRSRFVWCRLLNDRESLGRLAAHGSLVCDSRRWVCWETFLDLRCCKILSCWLGSLLLVALALPKDPMPMHLFGWWVANTIVFQHRTHDAPGGRSKVVVMTFALTTFMLALSNSSTIKLKDLEARCAYHIFLKAFGATEAGQRKIQASLGDGYPLLACWLRKQMLWRHDGSRLEPKQEPKLGSWYNRILNYVSIVLWNFCLYKLFLYIRWLPMLPRCIALALWHDAATR